MPAIHQATIDAILSRVQRDAEAIRNCFDREDTVADQLVGAGSLLMDLAKFAEDYGLEKSIVRAARIARSEASDLVVRQRKGMIADDDYQVEARQLTDRVLALTDEVEQTAITTLKQPAPVTPDAPTTTPQITERIEWHKAADKFAAARAEELQIIFRCENLGKRFAKKDAFALSGVTLTLRKGEITGLLGVNGSGKSTLLRIIVGSLQASEGTRAYPGLKCRANDWVTLRRRIAYVPQRPEPWPGTTLEVLIRQAACFGLTGAAGRDEVDFILDRLGLSDYTDKPWYNLSGGYRTRVELAKAMLSRPAMLVLDEPLAPLDIPAQMDFLEDLRRFATSAKAPMPVLLSSQHIYEVEAVADHMLVLDDGKVSYNGPTSDAGKNRNMNWFEISTSNSTDELVCALTDCEVSRIHKLGGTTYMLITDLSINAEMVLKALTDSRIALNHFRDASHSCRRFLES